MWKRLFKPLGPGNHCSCQEMFTENARLTGTTTADVNVDTTAIESQNSAPGEKRNW